MRLDAKDNDQSTDFLKQSQTPCYSNGFPKLSESRQNGICGMAPKPSRSYSLSQSHREYIESQSRYKNYYQNVEKGKPCLSHRPEYHQKPISRQLVLLRTRVPDPGSIKGYVKDLTSV